MDLKQLNSNINSYLLKLQQKITRIYHFVISRLKDFKDLTVAEQVAYPCILLGFVLVITSFILMLF